LLKIIEPETTGKEAVVAKINIKFMATGNLRRERITGIVG